MIVMVCIDDNGGMMFNNRRQSRDKVLTQKVINIASSHKLYIDSYSAPLFEGFTADIIVDDDFLNNANDDDFCFVENRNLKPYEQSISKLIVFKWNRRYPSDFDLDISLDGFTLISSEDFVGNSHEKITMEVYDK
ncbi:MAG: ribonuclease Z [Acutalibacteraceae bacterium]